MADNKEIDKKLHDLGAAVRSSASVVNKVADAIEQIDVTMPGRTGQFNSAFWRAVAAVFLIALSFSIGRLTSARTDMEQIKESIAMELKPQLQSEIVAGLRQFWKAELDQNNLQLVTEMDKHLRQGLNECALQTLTASRESTDELLTELIRTVGEAQTRDRRWIVNTLNQIENSRRRDNDKFDGAVKTLALQTERELYQTKRNVANLLVNYNNIDYQFPVDRQQ